MEVTKEDMKEFLLWLDTTGDDLAEEVVKHDVKETFKECFGIEMTDRIGWMLGKTEH